MKGHIEGNEQAKKAHGQENHHSIETFIEALNKDVESVITQNSKKKQKVNYTKEKEILLKNYQNQPTC